jgi:alkylation response protein AidB-like acyl-CoA dehydrogenase
MAALRPRLATALELALGDPLEPASGLSFVRTLEREARGPFTFPEEECALLDTLGGRRAHVPGALGGDFSDMHELAALYRAVASRDLTTAVAYFKTLLGSLAIWVAGSDAQRRAVADHVLDGGRVALALTERAHGSDLLASEVTARREGDGYALNGEKWIINNATRAELLTVLAATAPGTGPRACSLLLVDKRRLEAGSFRCLPPIATHGVRGIDLSGIAFQNAAVPRSALIGAEGSGLEHVLRFLQVSKTLICQLALGGVDTGLRQAIAFLSERTLYRAPAIDIPDTRDSLGGVFADMLIAESLAVVAGRALHLLPDQGSLLSAAAKYFAPVQAEGMLRELGVLLGARSYIAGPPGGIFEKIQRDTALMSLFDGSTRVNLSHVASLLASVREDGQAPPPALFRLDAALPALDFSALRMGRGSSLELLERARAGSSGLYESRLTAFRARLSAGAPARSRAAIALAKEYCELMAAAAAIHLWVENRAHASAFFARGKWLTLGVARLLAGTAADDDYREVADEALRRHRDGLRFSLAEVC